MFAAAALAVAGPPSGGVLPAEQAAYDAMIIEQAKIADARFNGSRCDAAQVEVVSIRPWKITSRPDMIVWREKVRVAGCGRTSVENLNIGRFEGTPPWRMTSGLPGDSLAEVDLQEWTYKAAVDEVFQDLGAGCEVRLADVYIAGRPGDVAVAPPGAAAPTTSKGHPGIVLPDALRPHLEGLDLTGAWMEVWPFQVCGKDRTLGVTFLPRKDGRGSFPLFMPIWTEVAAHGPSALPAPASALPSAAVP
ncbi:hypothetical protein [Caulobacter sp. D5]|uniref:hypothetical protein n=2 Tax=unclassified Caulobacter TaxID=2648921 RepID=UPI0011B6F12E|nr:hypothetical protein [Caulobacter sp. D5]